MVDFSVESTAIDPKDYKGTLKYKIKFKSKTNNFAINTILRNTGVTKTGGNVITATDIDGKTSASPLQIEDTANFFKAKANGGSNLVEFKLTANYTDSSGAPKSQDLALNSTEYIETDSTKFQPENTYQIINKDDVYSKLYWGADGGEDANKLIFEIPIELPEQVEQDKINTFDVSVVYSNEDYLEKGPITEQLDGSAQSNGITYTLNGADNTAAVTSYDNSGDGNVIIPEYVKDTGGNTYAVTSLADATWSGGIYTGSFAQSSNLKSVVIGKNVTSIGEYPVYSCSNLSSVTIPDSVTSISTSAFARCGNLSSLEIGNGLESIGSMAFEGCSSLSSVTIPKSVTSIDVTSFRGCSSLPNINVDSENANYASEDGVLFNKAKTSLLTYPQGKNETNYSIPGSVTSIGDYAFSGCSSLTSITIPGSVTSIGLSAFASCNNLSSVTIGNGVTSITSGAFCEYQTITFYVPTGKGNAYKTLLADSTSMGSFPDSYWTITETTLP